MTLEDRVAQGVARVHERIAASGGEPGAVRLVAVTKGFGPDAVEAALAAGVSDLGESYAQELATKAGAVAHGTPAPRWHFVGRLQRNKVKVLVPLVCLWHSVDRPNVVAELANRCPGASVLVQVNVCGRADRGGCAPAEAPALVAESVRAGLQVRGLMAVAPPGPAEDARPGFRLVTAMADRLGLVERSMGMSADLEIAVEEGSTMVRVGRALFGPRPASSGAAGQAVPRRTF